jgi:hypothetical protein
VQPGRLRFGLRWVRARSLLCFGFDDDLLVDGGTLVVSYFRGIGEDGGAITESARSRLVGLSGGSTRGYLPPASNAERRLDIRQPAAVRLTNDCHSPHTDTWLRNGPSRWRKMRLGSVRVHERSPANLTSPPPLNYSPGPLNTP